MIYISGLKLRNYRRLREVDIPLKRHTVIIGENNTGKSSVLELLDIALNPTRRGIFLEESDCTHGFDPDTTQIEAEIEIKPWTGPVFGTVERALFDPHIDILPEGNERILLKLDHSLDPEDEAFRTRIRFIKADGEDDGPFMTSLRRKIPFFMIPALRSAARDLLNRSGTWGRIVSGIKLTTESKESIKDISTKAAEEIMQLVLGNELFSETTSNFGEVFKAVLWQEETLGELSFSAMPANQRELLQAMQIIIKNPGDFNGVSILDHGDGTQSIAVVALMLAYINAMGYSNASLAMEEPESHLHPHATRSLIRYLWNRPRQVIITTHSTHVTDVVNLNDVVLLKRRGRDTVVCSVPDDYFSGEELQKLSRYIQTVGSEFFFAKCVLLTEGQTEEAALPIFAKALGIDFDRLGISLVDIGGSNFWPFIRLFQSEALDTSYVIMCDNDSAAVIASNTLTDLGIVPFRVNSTDIETRRADLESKGLYFLPTGNFEQYVMDQGNIEAYEQAIEQVHGPDRLQSYISSRVASDASYVATSQTQKIIDFINKERGKPEIAFEVANIITNNGSNSTQIPPYFTLVLRSVEAIAKQQLTVDYGDTEAGT